MIGRTKSWVWWLGGILCALVFGPAEAGEVIKAAKYGIRPRPGPVRPSAKPEDIKKADKLVEEYFTPVTAVAPTAGQKAEIAKLIRDFESEAFAAREAASKKLVGFGPAALSALRVATGSKDAEVATRATGAITGIQSTIRDVLIKKLKLNVNAAMAALGARRSKARADYSAAIKAEREARAAGNGEAEKTARQKRAAASKLSTALMALSNRIRPMRGAPAPVYGVRVMRAQ